MSIKNALKIILLTGVRTGELRNATWQEFDFEQSLWIIHAAHCKSRQIMTIHLSTITKTLLLELKKQNNSNYVLSIFQDSPLSDKALSKAVNRIQDRLGIPQWTPHDLRRISCR